MDQSIDCPLAPALARELRAARDTLTGRWLDRIAARVALDPNRVFPTDELLDHVPLLIDGIAAYVEDPAEEVAGDMQVIAKAMELGELRYAQGFDAYQILKEYEILGGVLFSFLTTIVDHLEQPCTRSELLHCSHRIFRAVSLIQQATTTHYLRKASVQVREREERLRGFNRMISHELKNDLGAIAGAHALLGESWLDAEKRARFLDMIGENLERVNVVLDNLISLSRLDTRPHQHRHVRLPQAAAEAVRQLRTMAQRRGVAVRLAADMPPVEVNAAAIELCLTNYLSNAIKYSDAAKEERWVEITAEVRGNAEQGGPVLALEVRDNGVGVPEREQSRLFERFFRTYDATASAIEGTGLGLSIVKETVESLGGSVWAAARPGGGSVFGLSLPCRRESDADVTPHVARALD